MPLYRVGNEALGRVDERVAIQRLLVTRSWGAPGASDRHDYRIIVDGKFYRLEITEYLDGSTSPALSDEGSGIVLRADERRQFPNEPLAYRHLRMMRNALKMIDYERFRSEKLPALGEWLLGPSLLERGRIEHLASDPTGLSVKPDVRNVWITRFAVMLNVAMSRGWRVDVAELREEPVPGQVLRVRVGPAPFADERDDDVFDIVAAFWTPSLLQHAVRQAVRHAWNRATLQIAQEVRDGVMWPRLQDLLAEQFPSFAGRRHRRTAMPGLIDRIQRASVRDAREELSVTDLLGSEATVSAVADRTGAQEIIGALIKDQNSGRAVRCELLFLDGPGRLLAQVRNASKIG